MKICMLGAGALGCSIGGVVARGGSDVMFVDRFHTQRCLADAQQNRSVEIRREEFDFAEKC